MPYFGAVHADADILYPFLKFMMIMGGTRKDNAAAAADSWPKAVQFFKEHLL